MRPKHRTVINICRRLGIPLGLGPADRWGHRWSWDGKKLDIRSRFNGSMGDRPSSDSLHDVAHWLIASPKRHGLPEFGLGSGVDARSREADLVVSYHYASMEESLTSLLGILMEKQLGWDWEETWKLHNWDEHDEESLGTTRRRLEPWLRKRGHSLQEILEACR